MSTEEWRILKKQFSKIEKVNTLVVKNNIANMIIKENVKKQKITSYINNGTFCSAKPDFQLAPLAPLAPLASLTPLAPLTFGSDIGVNKAIYEDVYGVTSLQDVYQKQQNKISQNTKEGKDSLFPKIYTLFQGPTFLIGINSPEQSKIAEVLYLTKKEKKLIFVGGTYEKKQINHLDLDSLLKLENFEGVHANLISTVQQLLYCTVLTAQSINLYYLLKFYTDIDTDTDIEKNCLKR